MTAAVTNTPFQPGFRLFRGEDLNAQFANPGLSTQTSVTAHAGGTRAAAFAITAAVTNVTTVASANDSLVLPSAASVLGRTYTIYNNGASAATLYAPGSDTINGTAGATGVSLPPGNVVELTAVASGKFVGITNGNTSASTVFAGSTSGTTTLKASAAAGTTTETLPAVTGVIASTTGTNLYVADLMRTSASVTANASITYANVTGLSFTVVPGTYQFELALPSTVASGTGGIKYAFNYTTAVLSVLEATGLGMTASAIAVQHTTTTTTQTDLFTQAAVVIFTRITGTMVVTTGGTVDVQMAQNTSNASNSVALIGGWGQFTRIA